MKRAMALLLCLALTLSLTAWAAEPGQPGGESWVIGDGDYVTTRLYWPDWEQMDWSEQQNILVRYADTGEPVALTSELHQGYVFATVPVSERERALEVCLVQPPRFDDLYDEWNGESHYNAPLGTNFLALRQIIRGDDAGQFHPNDSLTRAEAFTLMARLLSLEPAGDPGYADVHSGDWYYDAFSAARAAGIAAADTYAYPNRPVTRGELTVMLYRAMRHIGWMEEPDESAEQYVTDGDALADWAWDAYLAFGYIGIFSWTETESVDESSQPLARMDQPALRREMTELIYDALWQFPVYPNQAAIDYGFDTGMPTVDGSTSTYPYTQVVYNALFVNGSRHPQFPAAHSKSYYSYERLIEGDVDVLFASTKPTEDTLRKAEEAGVELELIPIAYDAMVFFTNPDNPQTGLTQEQIRSIYVDNAYDNWAQLGGEDAVFIPYCRNADSGSQAQMEQFFLHGDEIHPDIRRETTSVSMASVLTDVYDARRDDPLTWALGYSIYYYYQSASSMLLPEDGLKLLAVDGVYPTDETIADGSYPLAGYNYAVVRADAPADSIARRMVDFLLSPQGQQCVQNAGFGALIPPQD